MSNLPPKPPAGPATPLSLRLGAIISAGLALVLVAEIAGLSWHTFSRVQRSLQPEKLVDQAEQAIRENYPQFREEMLAELRERSPELARQASREMLASSADVRQWLERVAERQLNRGLDDVTELSAEQFRTYVTANRATVQQAFDELESAPDEARELILGTEASLEEQLGVDIQKQAEQTLAVHRALNDKLERLSTEGTPLAPRELLERRMLRILKALERQQVSTLTSAVTTN
jgi:hypothetical protein